jgi:peroxiredoxin
MTATVVARPAPLGHPLATEDALDLALWNAYGHRVTLSDYLAHGPLVVVFPNQSFQPGKTPLHAGCWRLMAEALLAGGNVVAGSPGGEADFVSAEEQLKMPVEVLADRDGRAIQALGVDPEDASTIILFAPDGRVVSSRGAEGETEAATLDEFFDSIRSLARATE